MTQFYSLATRLVGFALVFLFAGCADRKNTRFQLLSSHETGVGFRNILKDTPSQNIIEYLYYYNGGGVAVGDVNNDQLLDLYFTANQGINRLYLNKGGLKFEDATGPFGLPIGLDTNKWSTGVTMVDINADGYLDIYQCVVGDYKSFKGNNKLYINQSGEAFKESAKEYGLDFSGFSTHSAFFDYDRDGDLDMYLLNHSVHGTDSYGPSSLRLKPDWKSGDRFFENKQNENLGFIDVTSEVGIYSSRIGYGLGLGVSDLNNDGYLDIYVGNDFHEDDYIYLNNGDGSFIESSESLLGHTTQFTMGLDLVDINQDGRMDIFSLDMLPSDPTILLKSAGDDNNFVKDIKSNNGYRPQYSRNAMQVNYGDYFKEVAMFHDLYATDWSWSVLVQDYDNDLDQDLFITNGIYKRPNDLDYVNYLSNEISRKNNSNEEIIKRMPSDRIDNVYFENKGGDGYTNSIEENGLSYVGFSNGAAYADLDNDGDLDLVVNNLHAEASIFENHSETSSSFLNISLMDSTSSNRNAIGARIKVFVDSIQLTKELTLSRGFLSSIPPRLHFGLGNHTKIDSLHLLWPGGQTQRLTEINANQFLAITKEANGKLRGTDGEVPVLKPIPIDFVHLEDEYRDYQFEQLLPWAISKEGPAVAVADLNNDGIKDFYIGGAHFQPGELFLSDTSGFNKSNQPHIRRDAGYEDISATFIDLDQDGFLDLFVTSGGGRFSEGHPLLEDRVYLNNGQNGFRRLIIPLPKVNSSSISAGNHSNKDYLFVGGRSIPGSYGTTPISYLMKWENGSLQKLSSYQVGLVTDSKWVEFGISNQINLMVVGEWMPISLFQLENDSLVAISKPCFKDTNGFWNAISTGDLNDDGIVDYFFSNSGLNSKWKPTIDEPLIMYANDMDANGQVDPIIFNYYHHEPIPSASRMDLLKQVPAISKLNNNNIKFSNVRALNDLMEIENEIALYAYEVESKLLLSNGDDHYWAHLPDEVQYGAVQDAVLTKEGLIYVGNDFTNYSVLGRSDANHGGVIRINGKGVEWEHLGIDHSLAYRKIAHLGNDKYLVVPNSDRPFIKEGPHQ